MDYLVVNAKTTHLLVVLLRKLRNQPFAIPLQEMYQGMVPDKMLARYSVIVDGAALDGYRGKYLTDVPGKPLLKELRRRIINRVTRRFGG